jgi:hypothetical protein
LSFPFDLIKKYILSPFKLTTLFFMII